MGRGEIELQSLSQSSVQSQSKRLRGFTNRDRGLGQLREAHVSYCDGSVGTSLWKSYPAMSPGRRENLIALDAEQTAALDRPYALAVLLQPEKRELHRHREIETVLPARQRGWPSRSRPEQWNSGSRLILRTQAFSTELTND